VGGGEKTKNTPSYGGLPAFEEFKWVGREVRIGHTVRLAVLKRTVRCTATHVDALHGTGKTDMDPPQLLRKHFPEHGEYLGVYAQVLCGGTIRPGDAVYFDPSAETTHARRRAMLCWAVAFVVLLMGLVGAGGAGGAAIAVWFHASGSERQGGARSCGGEGG
jgi:hypothetical protein